MGSLCWAGLSSLSVVVYVNLVYTFTWAVPSSAYVGGVSFYLVLRGGTTLVWLASFVCKLRIATGHQPVEEWCG